MSLLSAIALFVSLFGSDEEMGRRVQALLRVHQAEVYGCVADGTAGELLVRVVAGEKGTVARAEVLKDQTGAPAVGACLVQKIRAWDLSPLGAAEGDQVVFPLAFKPWKADLDVINVALGPAQDCSAPREQALYVLEGPVKVNDAILQGEDLVWLPAREGCKLSVAARAPGRVLRVRAPSGKATGATQVVRARDAKSYPIAGGKGAARLYLDGRGASFAVDGLTADAGVKVPLHRHEGSDELIYVVAGRGTTTIEKHPVPTRTGEILHIPAGAEHALSVDEKLVTVQVYAPGGPEQRFKNK